MRYFPAFLDLRGKLCVVVGGGRVAERKVRSLLKAGASVRVVSPGLSGPLARLKDQGKITHHSNLFHSADLKEAFLSIGATDDYKVNERVFRQACKQRIPVNIVDDPEHCSFVVPSLVERGDLLIAVSTSGKSPALAKELRKKLQKEIGREYADLLKLLGVMRKKMLSSGLSQKKRKKIFQALIGGDILSLMRRGDRKALQARFREILGPGFPLKELGFKR